MSKFAIYLLEANLCLIGWYFFYRLVLNGEAYLRFNRYFLLGAVVNSLILPLLHLPLPAWGSKASGATVSLDWSEITIQPMTEVAASSSSTLLATVMEYWPYVYLTGVVIGLSIFLWRVNSILRLSHGKASTYIKHHRVVFTNEKYTVFSFGNTIYWNNSLSLTDPNASLILAHEIAHIRQYHTLDLLFLEMVRILFWFNPVLFFYLKSLREVHEFLADRHALYSTNPQTYASILLQQVLGVNAVSLSHSFNHSPIKQRIAMLYKSTITTKAWAKTLLALPMLSIMFYTISCTPDSTDLPVTPQASTELSDEQLEAKILNLGNEIDAIYEKHNVNARAANIVKDRNLKKVSFKNDNIYDTKDLSRLEQLIDELNKLMAQRGNHMSESSPAPLSADTEEEIFLVVSDQPSPKGGMAAFNEYLGKNIKHPGGDKEGRVFVEFVVNKEGKITSTKVVKGLGDPYDSEALRALANAPDWNPGQHNGIPVAVRMVTPIMFKKN